MKSIYYSFLMGRRIAISHFFGESLSDTQLHHSKTVTDGVLVPDDIYVAFPSKTGNLVAVLFSILHEKGIGHVDVLAGPLMIDAQNLGGRECVELDMLVSLAESCNI